MIGPPFLICSLKIGITDPLEPKTLPNLVDAKTGPLFLILLLAAVIRRSPINLLVPMTLVGFTALSELVNITFSTLFSDAALMIFCTPRILV